MQFALGHGGDEVFDVEGHGAGSIRVADNFDAGVCPNNLAKAMPVQWYAHLCDALDPRHQWGRHKRAQDCRPPRSKGSGADIQ
jgi:hypothetical protein